VKPQRQLDILRKYESILMGDAGVVRPDLLALMKEQAKAPKDKCEKKVKFSEPGPTKE